MNVLEMLVQKPSPRRHSLLTICSLPQGAQVETRREWGIRLLSWLVVSPVEPLDLR
jgi:hypothetical protein